MIQFQHRLRLKLRERQLHRHTVGYLLHHPTSAYHLCRFIRGRLKGSQTTHSH